MARTYQEAQAELGKRDSRKIGNNTYMRREGEEIKVKYHNTDIVTYRSNGDIVLDTNGWMTSTTKERLNKYTPRDVHIWQENSVWYVAAGIDGYYWESQAGRVVFQDGLIIHPDGSIDGAGEENLDLPKLKRRISKYIKDFLAAMDRGEVPAPNNGDCWDCLMVIAEGPNEGRALGEMHPSQDESNHVMMHIAEKYYVPSLLMRAVERYSISNVAKWWIASKWDGGGNVDGFAKDVAMRQIGSSMRRWIYHQLGLAS
jgi:hypothetical protein